MKEKAIDNLKGARARCEAALREKWAERKPEPLFHCVIELTATADELDRAEALVREVGPRRFAARRVRVIPGEKRPA